MSLRGVILGLGLGLVISATNHFVDQVALKPSLIGSHLPIGVFGSLTIAIILLSVISRGRFAWGLIRPRDLALGVAIALVACTFPGMGLMRRFTAIVAWPAYMQATRSDWQSTGLLSYVPGGSGAIASGQVLDWPELVRRLNGGRVDRDSADVAGRLWDHLDEPSQRILLRFVDQANDLSATEQATILRGINSALANPRLFAVKRAESRGPPAETEAAVQRLNRQRLVDAWPELIGPIPRGSGVLLDHADRDSPALAPLIMGQANMRLKDLPWGRWWPTLRLWMTVVLGTSLAALCLATIVHRQWYDHELLAYPIVRFARELTRADESGSRPAILSQRLFWAGLIGVVLLHLINGLHAWFPPLPQIPMRLSLEPLRPLFAYSSNVPGSWGIFSPRIIITVIAFTFFLPRQIGFTLGMSLPIWLFIGGLMVRAGSPVSYVSDRVAPIPMAVFGAYAAAVMTIVYLGRRYYLSVAAGALGLGRGDQVERHARWAARLLVLCVAVVTGALVAWGGLSWPIAMVLVVMILGVLLVAARMNAEAGVFMLGMGSDPLTVFRAVLGEAALGPTAAIVTNMTARLTLRRHAIQPFLINALPIGEKTGKARPGRLSGALAVMLVLGLIVAVGSTLWMQNRYSLQEKGGPGPAHWAGIIQRTVPIISQLQANGTLVDSVSARGLDRLKLIEHNLPMLGWAGIGFGAFVLLAFARLRWHFWPLHPVILLYFSQYICHVVSFSFLLGWVITAGVITIGGQRAHERLRPMMVGLIAGEMIAALGWVMVGVIYYIATGQPPALYSVW